MHGTEEVGRFTHRVKKAWPCLGSAVERPWLALGEPFLSFGTKGIETIELLVSISSVEDQFISYDKLAFPGNLD